MHRDTRTLARFAAAFVAILCAVVVLAFSPEDPNNLLAVGVLFAAIAALL